MHILVLAGHFTRWYDAIPIPNGAAVTIARILDERIFSYYRIPEKIHSDQGRQFESDLFQEFCASGAVRRCAPVPTIHRAIQ